MTTHSHLKFEATQPVVTQSSFKRFTSWMANTCKKLLKTLLSDQTEPRITSVEGHNGEVLWEIYEPQTGKVIYCLTDYEVMEWLDQRYYRQ